MTLPKLDTPFAQPPQRPNTGNRTPVLMCKEQPTGWKLEELLSQINKEMIVKCGKISGDDRDVARYVLANNEKIIYLLAEAETLQRDSQKALAAFKDDEGPLGKPRIGVGSA